MCDGLFAAESMQEAETEQQQVSVLHRCLCLSCKPASRGEPDQNHMMMMMVFSVLFGVDLQEPI